MAAAEVYEVGLEIPDTTNRALFTSEEEEERFAQAVALMHMLGSPLDALDLSKGFVRAVSEWGEEYFCG